MPLADGKINYQSNREKAALMFYCTHEALLFLISANSVCL